jgi:hypothetical protein
MRFIVILIFLLKIIPEPRHEPKDVQDSRHGSEPRMDPGQRT